MDLSEFTDTVSQAMLRYDIELTAENWVTEYMILAELDEPNEQMLDDAPEPFREHVRSLLPG